MTNNSIECPPFQFAYRSGNAIGFASYPGKVNQELKYGDKQIKLMEYSPNGQSLAILHADGISVVEASQNLEMEFISQLEPAISQKGLIDFRFSPKGSYISTFEKFIKSSDPNTPPHRNVKVWKLATGEVVCSFPHKNPDTWKLQWTEDESVFGRMAGVNQAHFYASSDFSKVGGKLSLEGMTEFSISPGKNPSVAAFTPEKKGQPAKVRLYGLMSFRYPLSNQTFFNAESAVFYWNRIGTNVLVLTHTDTDKSGTSYYGETRLYYLSAVGNYDCRVDLDAKGPVHDISWNSDSNEFIIVYGNMPAKAGLFDSRANKIFDFGASAKNLVRISPKGRLILLAGFGNLAGYVEVWDRKTLTKLSEFKEDSAVYCSFSPNGSHILTATLAPRLRVDNRFRVRDYWGRIQWECNFKEFLFQVGIKPGQESLPKESKQLDELSISFVPCPEEISQADQNGGIGSSGYSKRSYVPPHLRGRRDVTASSPSKTTGDSLKKKLIDKPNNAKVSTNSQDGDKIGKKILALERKLRQITQLKQKLNEGVELEKNQLEKIQNEPALIKNLQELKSSIKIQN